MYAKQAFGLGEALASSAAKSMSKSMSKAMGRAVGRTVGWSTGNSLIDKGLGGVFKPLAGVPAQRAFAPTARAGVANAARAAFRPRYPGLDRPAGSVGPVARPFDRSRQLAGSALRLGNTASMLGGTAVAANGVLNEYPQMAGRMAGEFAGQTPKEIEATQERMKAEAPGYIRNLVGTATGLGDTSAVSQFHTDVAGDYIPKQLAHDMYAIRENKPYLMNSLDALRSFSPAGLATTAFLRTRPKTDQPDLKAIAAKHLPKLKERMQAELIVPPDREQAMGARKPAPGEPPPPVQVASRSPSEQSPFLARYERALGPVAEGADRTRVQQRLALAANRAAWDMPDVDNNPTARMLIGASHVLNKGKADKPTWIAAGNEAMSELPDAPRNILSAMGVNKVEDVLPKTPPVPPPAAPTAAPTTPPAAPTVAPTAAPTAAPTPSPSSSSIDWRIPAALGVGTLGLGGYMAYRAAQRRRRQREQEAAEEGA